MSSLAATLLARSSATVQTRQALVITGLQNDFISPDGKLALKTRSAFIERIIELVPIFREHGNIIWVWTEYRGNRTVNDASGNGCMVMIPGDEKANEPASLDPSREQGSASRASRNKYPRSTDRNHEIIARAMRVAAELDLIEDDEESQTQPEDPELFLSETATRQACCKPGTWGAEPIPEIKDLIKPGDIHITKSFYSAFTQTSLLFQLRAKLITDLYFAGVNTNLSVYATATDAARHGLEINIVRNCMGCRQMDRHEEAIKQMVDYMGAQVTTAHSVVSRLRGEDVAEDEETEDPTDEDEDGLSETGPVRQSPFFQDQSQGSILKEPAPVTDQPKASIPPFEPAQSLSSEPATAPARSLFDDGSEGDKNEKATPADELGRQYISTSESVIGQANAPNLAQTMPGSWVDDGENKANAAGHRLTIRTSQLKSDESSLNGPMTHNTLAVTAAGPSVSQADIHRDTIHPSVVSKTVRSESRLSPADAAGQTSPARGRSMHKPNKKKSWQKGNPTLGPGDSIGSGDSSIAFDLLPPTLSDTIFQQLLHEVHWQRMYHAAGEVPRLVCCQGDIDPFDGTMPVYRHPSDHTLPLLHWSPGVARVRREAEKRVGHGLNHVLIQLYRNGQDYISEHTDKTLDILPGSSIVNVSFGAQRTMRLRTKRAASSNTSNESVSLSTSPAPNKSGDPGAQRTTQRIPMPHNSMFTMGLVTNAAWLHGITADKRLDSERTLAELAYNGMRVSLTFRNINTYLSADSRKIWGQGATSKDLSTARSTVNGDADSSQALIDAFGIENQSTKFDWHTTYGTGFDVLHLKTPLEDDTKPTLFLSGEEHADLAVKLYLVHLGVSFHDTPSNLPPDVAKATLSDASGNIHPIAPSHHRAVAFRDTDMLHTIVSGESAILLYLDRAYARYLRSDTPAVLLQAARELELLTSSLLGKLRDLLRQVTATDPAQAVDHLHSFQSLIDLDDYLLGHTPRSPTTMTSISTSGLGNNASAGRKQEEPQNCWLASAEFGIADCAFWSVIQAFRDLFMERFARSFAGLNEWARRVQGREEIAQLRDGRKSREQSRQNYVHNDDDEKKGQLSP
ncbi:hypothetical protein BDV97DRAFT_90276 [Delphinella strobiligena]|nr:hypothetical protein BDV97DRAFT_90276 [Delphinella strobiligena]